MVAVAVSLAAAVVAVVAAAGDRRTHFTKKGQTLFGFEAATQRVGNELTYL